MALECRYIAINTQRTGLRCNDGAFGKPVKYFLHAIDYVTRIYDGLTHRGGYERELPAAHRSTVEPVGNG
jgi:hypothetical protein